MSVHALSRRARGAAAALLALTVGGWLAERPARAQPVTAYQKVAGLSVLEDASGTADNAEFARLTADGANTVGVAPMWDVDAATRTQLAPGPTTLPDAVLEQLISQARQAGLRVMLDPIFQCSGCPVPWRGAVQPSDRQAFFASYRAMVNHYAELAQRDGAWLLVVGSEMNSLQGETAQWRVVSQQARARFHGPLAYSVNFDALGSVGFWDVVDMAGVSAYFPLSDEASPSERALRASWRDRGWLAQLARLAQTSGRPVLFTEAGYRSCAYGTRNPADAQTTQLWDWGLQANAYQALLETFEPQPWWAGVVWWDWHVSGAVATDASYTPRAKPAEQVLAQWYAPATPTGGPAAGPAGGTGIGVRGTQPRPASGPAARRSSPSGRARPLTDPAPAVHPVVASGQNDATAVLDASTAKTTPQGRPSPSGHAVHAVEDELGAALVVGVALVLGWRGLRRRRGPALVLVTRVTSD